MIYDRLKKSAVGLLTKFGRDITIQVFNGKVSNPTTGAKVDTYSNIIGKGVTLNYNNSEIDGSLIQSGDIRLLFEDKGLITINSKVLIDSDTYRVEAVEKIKPANTTVFYEMRLRR